MKILVIEDDRKTADFLLKALKEAGYTTLYAHLTSVSVSVGQMVSQGDTVGITGSTGNSTGPHLHYEVMINGVNQNPLDYLPGYIARW